MADVFWPGDERAGELFSPASFLTAMARVESAWLEALVGARLAPPGAAVDLTGLVGADDVERVAAAAESTGTPVVPLLELLQERLTDPLARTWLHRGLTSQDVVDTAIVLCSREVRARVTAEIDVQVDALGALAERHRDTLMAGRTLTQHAVPITFGLKAANWLSGLLDARDGLQRLQLPASFGGAAGTLAATVELARLAGLDAPAAQALDVVTRAATTLGLAAAEPWHTTRTVITRTGDAMVAATDAWGRIANDVMTLTRPEIGELAEAAGRGGSSTMPQKANPILSVLIRRAALAAPALGAQLHAAASESVDERAGGAWHGECAAMATLARRTVVAASQATELIGGLEVGGSRMAATAHAAATALLAEQRSLDGRDTGDPSGYLGATGELIDAVLTCAARRPPSAT